MLNWIKNNKLASFLLIIVFLLLISRISLLFSNLGYQLGTTAKRSSTIGLAPAAQFSGINNPLTSSYGTETESVPSSISQDRLTIQESSISMVVKQVRESVDQILNYTQGIGGFMVSSSLSRPEDAPYANVVLRVPVSKFKEALGYFRNLASQVTSENIMGTDITQEYEDIEAKIATHEKIKAKFEEIMQSAFQVNDLLNVQRELINVQAQIDALKGRQKYLNEVTKTAKITLYLSTDEWSLPYTPIKPFRPGVIFKQAVRSLVKTLQGLATKLIWLVVYSVIWGPILIIIYLWRRRKNRHSSNS